MNWCEWVAGECPAAITPDGTVVLEPGHDELVRRIWSMMSQGTQFTSLVQVLTSEFGANLMSFPAFAIILREGEGGRVAARGGFKASVRAGDEVVSVDGASLITWAEFRVAAVDAWLITGPEATNARATGWGTGLVRDAVVPISRLSMGEMNPQPPVEEKEAAPAQEEVVDSKPQPVDPNPARATWEATQSMGSFEQGAVVDVEPGRYARENSASVEAEEYHDGLTISHLPQAASAPEPEEPSGSEVEEESSHGPEVLSVPCIDGHHNPPYLQSCRICGKEMSRTLARIERPSLGRLVLSSGEVIELDRDLVFGRNPRDPHRAGRPHVRLVPVGDQDHEVSRNHCEIRIEGWDARIRDLGSQNGTFVTHPGQATERVGETGPVILRCGDLIELGTSVSMRLEC